MRLMYEKYYKQLKRGFTEKEMQEGKVAVRKQSKGDLGTKTVSESIDFLKEEIDSKRAFD